MAGATGSSRSTPRPARSSLRRGAPPGRPPRRPPPEAGRPPPRRPPPPPARTTWEAGRTHGAQLLPAIGRLTGEANLRRSRIRGVIVGTGPGAFTGLRVGIATAKALAHELRVPIAGVSSAEALLAAADVGPSAVLLAPAGPNDRTVVRAGQAPELLIGGTEPAVGPDDVLVAVGLAGRAPSDAIERGERAREGFAAALLRIGA